VNSFSGEEVKFAEGKKGRTATFVSSGLFMAECSSERNLFLTVKLFQKCGIAKKKQV
jgi:hypothetical protein